jgi:hypothetical protein
MRRASLAEIARQKLMNLGFDPEFSDAALDRSVESIGTCSDLIWPARIEGGLHRQYISYRTAAAS